MIGDQSFFNMARDLTEMLNREVPLNSVGQFYGRFLDHGDNVPRPNRPLHTSFENPRFVLRLLETGDGDRDGDTAHQRPIARSPESLSISSTSSSSSSSSSSSPEPSAEVDPSEDAVSPNGTGSDDDLRRQSEQSSSNGTSVAEHGSLRFSQSLYDRTQVHLFNIAPETTTAVVPTASGRPVAPEVKRQNIFYRFFSNIFSKVFLQKTETETVTEPCPAPAQSPTRGSWWSRVFRYILRGSEFNGQTSSMTRPCPGPLSDDSFE